jgi:hypothetical protein
VRSQSSGIGTAPSHDPIKVPTAAQYVHFRMSLEGWYSIVSRFRRVSCVGTIDENIGNVVKIARCNERSRVCGTCVVNGAPKRIIMM